MPEYIDKEKLYQYLDNEVEWRNNQDRLFALESVSDFPAADVSPVVHGKWEFEPETINTYSVLKCSKCGWWTLDLSVDGSYHHCPNCGVKLDLEDD